MEVAQQRKGAGPDRISGESTSVRVSGGCSDGGGDSQSVGRLCTWPNSREVLMFWAGIFNHVEGHALSCIGDSAIVRW